MKKLLAGLLVFLMVGLPVYGMDGNRKKAPTYSFLKGRPITLIVPWSAGGSTDITARAIAQVAKKVLGVAVVVENREGGGSTIGTQYAATAKGDGHTILVATINALSIMPHTLKLNYTPKDFRGVGQVCVRDIAIFTNASNPWNDFGDFIKAAKKKPGKYLFGTPQGGLQHLVFEMLAQETGFDATLYPVSGDSEALTALLGGTVDICIPGSFDVVAGQVKAGKVKALAVLSDKRADSLPATPTLKELGYDVSAYPWTALLLPAATPERTAKEVEAAFAKVLQDPDLMMLLFKNGQIPMYKGGTATMKTILEEYQKFGKIVAKIGLGH